jgi:uncharacterized damage-inducible protein DinB
LTTHADVFFRRWTSIHSKTLGFMAAIPEELLGFTPQQGYRTVEEMVRHLLATEQAIIGGLENGDFRWSEAEEAMRVIPWRSLAMVATDLDARLAAVAGSSSDEWLEESGPGSVLSRGEWLWQLLEHEVHHRGQLSLMLRLGGTGMPPLYA